MEVYILMYAFTDGRMHRCMVVFLQGKLFFARYLATINFYVCLNSVYDVSTCSGFI